MSEGALTRWVGIDEAGYGPNLGPLVMTAVLAEGPAGLAPDVWADLAPLVDRAGGDPQRLWIDDSKRITQARDGLARLEAATRALLHAINTPGTAGAGTDLPALLQALDAGSPSDGEWDRWLDREPGPDDATEPPWVTPSLVPPNAAWRFLAARSCVVGPAAFNAGLDRLGNKAAVHFAAFARLLEQIWDQAEGRSVIVNADKHGGRHFYLGLLQEVFPDRWIDRGEEGPALSRYTIRDDDRRLELRLAPRSDADNGLVALASMVSKALRERWMAAFNAFWSRRAPGLRPTAGYPVDARRFRSDIESHARQLGLPPQLWWRSR